MAFDVTEKTNEELILEIRAGINVKENYGLLVEKNRGITVKAIMPYIDNNRITFEDLWQESFFALVKTVELMDFSRGSAFGTVYGLQLKSRFNRYLDRMQKDIRLPAHFGIALRGYKQLVRQSLVKTGKMPDEETVRKKLRITKNMYEDVRRMSMSVLSLDVPIQSFDTDKVFLKDTISSDFNLEEEKTNEIAFAQTMELLDEILGKLPERNVKIMKEYYQDGKTLQTISEEFGITRERVRQICNNVSSRVIDSSKGKKLRQSFESLTLQ